MFFRPIFKECMRNCHFQHYFSPRSFASRTVLCCTHHVPALCFCLRVDSLGSALELMDSVERRVAEMSERLDKFIKEPKDVRAYTLIDANILKDVKVGNELRLGHLELFIFIFKKSSNHCTLLVDLTDDLLRMLCNCVFQ